MTKLLGITAEYNPFHNGHLYHLKKAREESGSDFTIVLMSGNFTQRGEPAISDKWERAKAALQASAGTLDAIFELPFAFACNRAEIFASGSVDILIKLGVDCISFGCETGNYKLLHNTAVQLERKKQEIAKNTKDNMKSGISYAKAYENAVRDELGNSAADMIMTPNNILAIEYLKRIEYWRERGIFIEVFPVKRKGSGYNEVGKGYAGASQIRNMIKHGKEIDEFVPINAGYEDTNAIDKRYFEMLKGIITRSSKEDISEIYCIGEGLENKLKKELRKVNNLTDYINMLISKRYTASAIRRILVYTLMGLRGVDMDKMINDGVDFTRLLAAGSKGRKYIRNFKRHDFEIVTNVNKHVHSDKGNAEKLLDVDTLASDMYNLLRGKDLYEGSDKVMHPFIV